MYYFPDYRRYVRILQGFIFCVLKAVFSHDSITETNLVRNIDLSEVNQALKPFHTQKFSVHAVAIYRSSVS